MLYACKQSSDDSDCGSHFSFPGKIDDHKTYFNIKVGTHCNSLSRKKRSSDNTAWDKAFSNHTCKAILNPNFKSTFDTVNTLEWLSTWDNFVRFFLTREFCNWPLFEDLDGIYTSRNIVALFTLILI